MHSAMSTRHPLPRLLLLRRPLHTKPNSAIARALRRSEERRPQQRRPATGLKITRSPVRPPPPPVPTNGIWTPPGAPPRPKDDFPTPPPRAIHSRVWTPRGARVDEELGAYDGAGAAAERVDVPEPRRGSALGDRQPRRDWAAEPPTRPPRSWGGERTALQPEWRSEEEAPSYSYSAYRPFETKVRSSPRLDSPPMDREWVPKPKRYIPKLDYGAEWIYGTSVVEAALKAGRRKCLKLYIFAGRNRAEDNRERDKEMAAMARQAGAEVVWEEDLGVLDSMSESRPHNGYVLETHPLPKTPILALGPVSPTRTSLSLTLAQHSPENTPISPSTYPAKLYSRSPKPRYPFILLLDDILDPGNLGAIIRSAYFLGVTAVSLSARNCAPLSSVALKASAGAAEFLPILEHGRSERVVRASVENGWSFFAAVPPVTRQQERRDRYFVAAEVGSRLEEGPVCLVVGSEGEGLRMVVRRECEFCVGLERAVGTERVVDSLNVSVASALLCNAFLKG